MTGAPDPAALAALQARALAFPRPWSASEIAGLLAAPGAILCAPDATGFALGRVTLDEAEVLTLVVDPGARRQGRGRALLSAFEAAATAAGARTGFLEVAADNAPALGLYLAAGWQVQGRRKGYYHTPDGPRVDAILMGKALLPGQKESVSY